MESKSNIFSKGQKFWTTYTSGRPSPPDSFFDRIFRYHEDNGGKFDISHDVGAGSAPYATRLRERFEHVIVSDIAARNVAIAKDRLGTSGYSYRAAGVEEADDILNGSVDLVFASNVMHFCDQEAAMTVIARQLRSGGTFACAAFGTARFDNAAVQDIYEQICQCGGRALLRNAEDPTKLLAVMSRTGDFYNVAPLDPNLFMPGAQRIHLNMKNGGIVSPLPKEYEFEAIEPMRTGPADICVDEEEEGWSFTKDLEGLREHLLSFPFATADTVAFEELWQQLEDMVRDDVVHGVWPAKIILATKR